MDFNHYCKDCGNIVEFDYGEMIMRCPTCNKEITRKDTISGYTKEARITQLKAMHELMCEANDEYIYMSWIYTMPDCPTEEDFEFIAIGDERYNECFDKFVKLIAKKGNRY